MPHLRRLPSGKWQATVRTPGGKRYTRTDPLRRVVADWARDEETKMARGLWRDPRAGRITVGEWAERWFAARVVEYETRRGDRGTLNNHVLPQWRDWPLNSVTRLDVQSWIRGMQQNGKKPFAIRRSYNLFNAMVHDAVIGGILAESPCRDISRPPTPPKLVAWFTRAEVDAIRARLDRKHRGHSAMVELMCVVGPRWGEAAATCGGPRDDGNPIDWLRGRLRIVGALSQHGRWKEYPKTSRSRREVPVPRYLLDELGPLLDGREPTGYVFVSPRAKSPLSGANWRGIWYDAIDAANAEGESVPRLDPHDCRHTAASWLAQDGVSLQEIQQLLGHESSQTTQRYAHLQPDAYAAVQRSWERTLPHVQRTEAPTRRLRGV